ncbi:MAG: hypothetical protein HY881_09360 [Deltaproteobacteria bacterium]|nr:hypothetical protein [Deltaproteobacteria bacterium]
MEKNSTGFPVRMKSVELTGRQQLVLRHEQSQDVLQFFNAKGAVVLTVHVTENGPVLRFDGDGALTIQTTGALSIEAEHLSLHGRSGVSVTSDGDMHLRTSGDLHTHGRIQNISASLGNVNVKANDDVRLDGERVLVNCVDT